MEGNRRLTVINLMFDPELAKDTILYRAFTQLNKNHVETIPKMLNCVVMDKSNALIWINRKHSNRLKGAGTEHWSSIAKARADVAQGISRPDLDVLKFVLTNPSIDQSLKNKLTKSKFKLTTLGRFIGSKEFQETIGLVIENGNILSNCDNGWLQGLLTDIVTTIATGERAGEKFTERNIDNEKDLKIFVNKIVADHPEKRESDRKWIVTGNSKVVFDSHKQPKTPSIKTTPSTENRRNLVPKKFTLNLPDGKINNIFKELKKLDVSDFRNAVSILFRVFLELSVDHFLKSQNSFRESDNEKPRLSKKLEIAIDLLEKNGTVTKKDARLMKTQFTANDSPLATHMLHAYVHSTWMNATPDILKSTWDNAQLMIELIWATVNADQK